MEIQFKIKEYHKGKYYTEKNTCFLVHEKWDDYGYNYLYEVHYTDNNNNFFFLGETRIMSEEPLEEILKRNDYKCLDDNSVSLGLYNFYENLLELEDENVKKYLLKSIKDCIYNRELYDKFKDKEGMNKSLLRDIYYEEVYKEYGVLLKKGEYRQTRFNLDMKLDSNNEQTIKINVIPDSTPPTNIHAIIGRNASGKTQLFEAIVKYYDNYEYNIFYNNHENTVKNNIYKNFKLCENELNIIQDLKKIIYIPININKELKNIEDREKIVIIDRYNTENDYLKQSLEKCLLQNLKRKLWIEAIKQLETDPLFKELDLTYIFDKNKSEESLNNVIKKYELASSGHKYIILSITKIVEMIDPKSLVLIDEPENHLHPTLLSSFIRALSYFLRKRNGFCILATHSPVVLQEIPKSCVYYLRRYGNEFSIETPDIETFAENVGTLTSEVFKLEFENSGFYSMLSDEVKNNKSYKEILKKYDNKIGLEGRAILSLLLSNKKD